MVASAREHDLDRLLYLIEIGGGGWQHHGRLCEEKKRKKKYNKIIFKRISHEEFSRASEYWCYGWKLKILGIRTNGGGWVANLGDSEGLCTRTTTCRFLRENGEA